MYLRGVSPHEAREAVLGRNGRVDDSIALTNRGYDPSRLAFGLNEPGKTGVNPDALAEVLLDAAFYANIGAHAQTHNHLSQDLQREVDPNHRGYFILFETENQLAVHDMNKVYGNSWRTTSELTDGIEKNLVGVSPAPPMHRAGAVDAYLPTDYSLNGDISIDDFDALELVVNTKQL